MMLQYDRSLATVINRLRPDFAQRDRLRRKLKWAVIDGETYFATIPKDIRDIIENFVPDLRINNVQPILDHDRQQLSTIMSKLSAADLQLLNGSGSSSIIHALCDDIIVNVAITDETVEILKLYQVSTNVDQNNNKLIAHYPLSLPVNPACDTRKSNLILANTYCVAVLPCGLICLRKAPNPRRHVGAFYLYNPQSRQYLYIDHIKLKVGDCINDIGEIVAVNTADLLTSRLSPLFCGVEYERLY